jgi:hypothetical protein
VSTLFTYKLPLDGIASQNSLSLAEEFVKGVETWKNTASTPDISDKHSQQTAGDARNYKLPILVITIILAITGLGFGIRALLLRQKAS